MERRNFLKTSAFAGLGAMLASQSLYAYSVSPPRMCRPVICGSLWWYRMAETAKWGSDEWKEELNRQLDIGFDLLWIGNSPTWLTNSQDASLFLKLMDLCAERNMKVILSTGMDGRWYQKWDINHELSLCGEYIDTISNRFKNHPAFWAWYIPHEIYMKWDSPNDYIQQLYPALVERCKQAADLPVTVSPFFILDRDKIFGDFRYNEPEEYADFWSALIRKSGIDIVMLQDSGEHFSYVTNDMRRPFFEAMAQACRQGGAKFWGNVEVAEYECPSIEEYVKRYGKVHHSAAKNIPWRAVPIDRLREKLDLASEYCERIVSWGYQEFCRPVLGEKASKWYADYLDYVKSSKIINK